MVSVIVTTKNEEHNIANCLESIKAQNLSSQFPVPNFHSSIEIIVVDNNSTDKTKEIVEEFKKRFTLLNVQLFNWGPERSAQRNFGVREASGKYILYLDADMILSGNIISECIEKCENSDIIALYIPERIVNLSSDQLNKLCLPRRSKATLWGNQSFWMKARNFERSFYNATAIDCLRFVRKDKFLEIGGFDENLTGPEDWDFDRRIKQIGEVNIINVSIYHNEGEFNLRRYLKKKTYYSQSFDKYIQKWPRNDPIIKKQLGFWYRYFGVFAENGKWKKLLRHPMLTLGMYFLRFLVGLGYVINKIRSC